MTKIWMAGMIGLIVSWANVANAWTLSPASKEIGAKGGSFTLTVSGTEYYDWVAGSDAEWITVTRVNAKTFSVVVKANDTSDERRTSVQITAFQGGTTHSAQTFVNFQHCSITQAGQNKPSVDPVAISFPKAGGAVTVDVTAASGDTWEVVESLSWLTASATSGKGDGRVTLTASENPSCLPRAGILTIAGKEITVTQAGEPGYSRIVYGNLRGAENPNPDYYKEGEKFVLMPLRDIDGYKFAGWKPAMIEASQTGEVEVVANWRSTNYCEIVDVVARQRYPWNGMVDIAVKITGESNDVAWADCIFAATNVATCVGLPVTHVTRAGDDVGSGSVWIRRFVWDAAADVGEVKIDDVALTVVVKGVEQGGVQLWKGGPYWSECNVGATKPEQYGYYFWWGDTVGYKWSGGTLDSDFDYANVTWQTSKGEYADSPFAKLQCPTYEKSNSALQTAGYIDSTGNLVANHDAATAHLGLPWRMPTHDDFDGLANRCDAVWTNTNGVYGCLVKGRGEYASKSIFLPAGGFGRDGLHYVFQPGVLSAGIYHGACFYWSSTRYSEYNAYDSCSMDSCYDYCHDPRWAHTSGINAGGQTERNYGMTVRPLRDFVDPPSVAMANLSLDCRVGVRVADAMEAICFSPVWETLEDGAVATVMVNDTQVTNAIDAGEFEWTPLQDGTFVLSHIVSVNGLPVGETLHATFIVEGAPIPATPVISSTSLTTFESPLTITITCATKGAKIYYTLNGADPTEQSSRYDGGFVVRTKGGVTIKTVAISPTGERSEVATLEIPAPNAPTISPASGTIIGSSVSVNIASDNPNATIYYTTDGTEPTTDSPVYSRFKASKKMTVKAIAVVDGMAWSETATAEYALGQCADPVITPEDGTIFDNSNYQVSIAKNGDNGILRYTIDGSDPTETSPVYIGPFTINVTTTVKAKTFDSEYFDSAIVSATLTRHWTKVATPIIDAVERFSGTKTSVSLSCETEGAVIRYTTDGSDPNSHSPKYTGMFEVTATTVIKAIALKTDCENSNVATLTITKEWGIGDALNDPDRSFVTDSSTGWMCDTVVSHDGNEAMKSGPIANSKTTGIYSTSSLSTMVNGKGVVQFVWKASCEEDEEFDWDHGEFQVDGVTVVRINGETGWEALSYEITTDGDHVLSWVYSKDDFGSEGDDCIWVDEFDWTPTPAASLLSLTVEGVERVVDGCENTYLCMAYYDDGTSVQVVPTWTVVSGDDCATINSAGILTAKKVGNIVVAATYTNTGVTKTATLSVAIVKGLSSVEISGPTSVYAGDSAMYSCLARYTDGSVEVVNADWILMSGSGCATLNSAGSLTALDVSGTATIKASFTYEGETKTAMYSVVVSRQILVDADVTGGSAAFVPVSWVNQYPTFRMLYGNDLVAAMAMLTGKKDGSGKQLTVWHDYVAGTDPTDVNDVFHAIIEIEDGLPKVGWRPNLNENGEVRIYKVYGRRSLSNEDIWEYPANSVEHRLFKVDVSMPEKNEDEDFGGHTTKKPMKSDI